MITNDGAEQYCYRRVQDLEEEQEYKIRKKISGLVYDIKYRHAIDWPILIL